MRSWGGVKDKEIFLFSILSKVDDGCRGSSRLMWQPAKAELECRN